MQTRQTRLIFTYEDKKHEFNQIRTLNIDGEVWFVANDVCEVLGIENPQDATGRLDRADVDSTDISSSGQVRKMSIINESAFYVLVFQSEKPEAERFKRWVAKEVIPAIRKNRRLW